MDFTDFLKKKVIGINSFAFTYFAIFCVILKLIRAKDLKVKVKVKLNLEQATKAQRGSRGIALLFL